MVDYQYRNSYNQSKIPTSKQVKQANSFSNENCSVINNNHNFLYTLSTTV